MTRYLQDAHMMLHVPIVMEAEARLPHLAVTVPTFHSVPGMDKTSATK